MSDGTTPGTEGEANQGAAGAAGAGSAASTPSGDGSGSQSNAGTPADDQVAQIEARRRALQSENDRLKNELAAAQAAVAPKDDDKAPAPLSEDRIMALMRREREMARAESTLREQYKLADPDVFDRDYPSAEALTVAVQESHDRISALVGQGTDAASAALLARYVEKYGELDPTPPDANGGTPTGDPTVAQIEAMDFLELDRYEQDHPGVIDRVMRSVGRN